MLNQVYNVHKIDDFSWNENVFMWFQDKIGKLGTLRTTVKKQNTIIRDEACLRLSMQLLYFLH